MYRYRAYTPDKKVVEGMINAISEGAAEEALYQAGYRYILSLAEVRSRLSPERLIPTFFGVKTQDVVDFSRQLATLIESGIGILTALQLLEGQVSRVAFQRVIAGLAESLRGGSSFSQVLSSYPQVFSNTYCQVMKASEQAGNLEVGLRQMADYMERTTTMTRKITRAMAYPALVLFMAVAVFFVLITVALPPLVGLFTSLGAELPWMTRLLIATADFLIDYKLHLFIGVFTLIILVVGYIRLPVGKLAMDKFLLEVPIIGSINIQRNMCHFCQTASMLLKAGLRLPQVMDIVTQTIGNRVIRQALRDVRDKMIQGQGLSQPMATIDLFPKLVVEMVVVGEKTGNLDSSLSTLANFYEQRVDQRISTLVAMIEPLLTVISGLVVAFIALSMITPLYSILGAIQ